MMGVYFLVSETSCYHEVVSFKLNYNYNFDYNQNPANERIPFIDISIRKVQLQRLSLSTSRFL